MNTEIHEKYTSPFVQALASGTFDVKHSGKTSVISAYLGSGACIRLFKGDREDTSGYLEYLSLCRNWFTKMNKGPVPTFRRKGHPVHYCSSAVPKAFEQRVSLSAAMIREQDTDHRVCDVCMEMGDGWKLVFALMKMSQNDPFLELGIKALGDETFARWTEVSRTGGEALPLLGMCV